MKKILLLIPFTLLLLFVFSSCELFEEDDTSVAERINLFEADLNTRNFDNIVDNFHSDMQSGQQALWDGVYEDGIFIESNAPFIFEEPSSIVDGASNEMTAFGDYANEIDDDQTYTFTMKEEISGDGNWKIKEFYIGSAPIFRGITSEL